MSKRKPKFDVEFHKTPESLQKKTSRKIPAPKNLSEPFNATFNKQQTATNRHNLLCASIPDEATYAKVQKWKDAMETALRHANGASGAEPPPVSVCSLVLEAVQADPGSSEESSESEDAQRSPDESDAGTRLPEGKMKEEKKQDRQHAASMELDSLHSPAAAAAVASASESESDSMSALRFITSLITQPAHVSLATGVGSSASVNNISSSFSAQMSTSNMGAQSLSLASVKECLSALQAHATIVVSQQGQAAHTIHNLNVGIGVVQNALQHMSADKFNVRDLCEKIKSAGGSALALAVYLADSFKNTDPVAALSILEHARSMQSDVLASAERELDPLRQLEAQLRSMVPLYQGLQSLERTVQAQDKKTEAVQQNIANDLQSLRRDVAAILQQVLQDRKKEVDHPKPAAVPHQLQPPSQPEPTLQSPLGPPPQYSVDAKECALVEPSSDFMASVQQLSASAASSYVTFGAGSHAITNTHLDAQSEAVARLSTEQLGALLSHGEASGKTLAVTTGAGSNATRNHVQLK